MQGVSVRGRQGAEALREHEAVVVVYSGGLEEHSFELCWNGLFTESELVGIQVNLNLEHDASGDACATYLTETTSALGDGAPVFPFLRRHIANQRPSS